LEDKVLAGLIYPPRGDTLFKMGSSHTKRKQVLNRLSRIEGHIRGIKKMIEEDRDCPDILHQIAAVKSSINKVGELVLEDHIESCLIDAVKEGSIEQYMDELKQAIKKLI
jgi:DNA-binding FrmR family transcriptional regulator